MSGYAPLFSSLTTGTLCGRWPDIGLWPIVLSLADRHGVIDVTPAYLAGVTGLSLDEVVACMIRFCQPDPYSRSSECAGARLKLLDSHREWGWQVVNHTKYREKARLMAKSQRETESGLNAVRLNDRRRPPVTAEDRPSDKTIQNKTKSKNPPTPQAGEPAVVEGLDANAWECWQHYRREIRKPIKPVSMQAAQRELAGFGSDQAAVVQQSIAKGWTGLFALKSGENSNGPRSTKTKFDRLHDQLAGGR